MRIGILVALIIALGCAGCKEKSYTVWSENDGASTLTEMRMDTLAPQGSVDVNFITMDEEPSSMISIPAESEELFRVECEDGTEYKVDADLHGEEAIFFLKRIIESLKNNRSSPEDACKEMPKTMERFKVNEK